MQQLLILLGIPLLTGLFIFVFWQRIRTGRPVGLRPLSGYTALKGQVGWAVESGSRQHIGLGQAGLTNPANPTTLAGTAVLSHLAQEGYINGIPPLVTVGEGTILPLAHECLRYAYQQADAPPNVRHERPEFVAPDTAPFIYAGGVSNVIKQERVISNVMVGRFGPELSIVNEAAERLQVDQVIGSDNLIALAVAVTATEDVLVGEELLVAGAYLERRNTQLASLQAQDLLRWLISLAILGIAVYQFIQ